MQMQYVVPHKVHKLVHSAIDINAVEESEKVPSVEKELCYFEDRGLYVWVNSFIITVFFSSRL